jgi:outer membrane beta-barrel protein
MSGEARTAMKRRFVSVVLATLAAGAILSDGRAEAQEIQLTGPLKGAPAVRKMRYYREGRFELAPTVSFTLLDEYRRTILIGGRLQYNITDWLGIGVWGAFGAISSTTDLTDNIDATSPRNAFTAVNVSPNRPGQPAVLGSGTFADQTGKLDWLMAPQLQLVPFRGKLALFQKIFLDTDLYFHVGPGIASVTERSDCGAQGQTPCSGNAHSFDTSSRTAFTVTGGLGLNFYASNFVSFGVEYRVFPFSWNRSGFDTRGAGPNNNFPDQKIDSSDRTFSLNQMITIGVGFTFPTQPRISE